MIMTNKVFFYGIENFHLIFVKKSVLENKHTHWIKLHGKKPKIGFRMAVASRK